MAYPVIESLTSGSLNTANTHTHNIPMPAGLEVGDIIVCFISITSPGSYACIAVPKPTSTPNFCPTVYMGRPEYESTWTTGTRIFRVSLPRISYNVSLTAMIVEAWATNTLDIYSCLVDHNAMPYANWIYDNYIYMYSKPAYVCYRISGAYRPLMGASAQTVLSHQVVEYSQLNTANWDLPSIPRTDDADSEDYLWMIGVASPTNMVAAFPPSGFTMVQTVNAINGDSAIPYSSSISTCYKEDNAVTQLNPGAFTANACDYCSLQIRIRPAAGSAPAELPAQAGGIGMFVHRKNVRTPVPQPGAIEVLPATMDFDYEGTECSNPFNTYVQVVALGSWEAVWDTGTHFDASAYSGDEGVTYIAITCKAENSTAASYTDTITFTSGVTNDTVLVEQYATGITCS